MEHLGDITKISGYTAPIVDCVIGGSPCQDLSIAGKRAGLDGERSGLFMEQIRIIKEMRKRNANNGTTDIRPRYMGWENVPGAFSSNKGEDFRIVLEETAKVADENAVIPEPPKGKWTTSGCIMGDGWSIAWRVLDAQFWGVPQRRRRIALVADFGGYSASEILFVRKGVSGDIEQSKQKRKNSSEDASGCTGTTDSIGVNGEPTPITLKIRSGCEGGGKGALVQTDKSATLGCNGKGWREDMSYTLNTLDRPAVVYSVENHPNDSRVKIDGQGKVQTLSGRMGTGGGNVPLVLALDRETCNCGYNFARNQGKTPTLTCTHGGEPVVCYRYIVRRLTPLECERLQGFPDGWSDIGEWTDSNGKVHKTSDSARYKALGNSIALPPWKWVLKRLCACYERDATMASLFDGIGGFPYIWEQINGKGSCLWASEIEEFPIAVTKERINKCNTP